MATEKLRYFIEAVWKGGGATAKASADIEGVGDAAEKAGRRSAPSLESIAKGVTGIGIAAGGMYLAAREAWQLLGEGADLEAAEIRFSRLSESIDSTADVMLGRLKQATKGLVSDADLVASATEIMSLGLQDTEDGVVRLATVSGNLAWDMNQVILTMANNSKARLDALGLSIEDVETRMVALQEQGFDADKAFDLAVIEAGEAKYLLLGDAADTTAGKMQILETALENANNEFKIGLAEGFAEGIGDIGDTAAQSADDIALLTGRVGTFFGSFVGGAASAYGSKERFDRFYDIASDIQKSTYAYLSKGGGRTGPELDAWVQSQLAAYDAMSASNPEAEKFQQNLESIAPVAQMAASSVNELNSTILTSAASSEGLTGTIYDLSISAEGLGPSLLNTAAGIAAVGAESEAGMSQVAALNAELDRLNGRTVEANINLSQRFFDAGGGGGFHSEQTSAYLPGEGGFGAEHVSAPRGGGGVNVNTVINTTPSDIQSNRSEILSQIGDDLDRAAQRAGY